MKRVIARSTAYPDQVGPFSIVRALPNRSVSAVGPIIFLDHLHEKHFAPGELPATDGSFAHPHRGIATFSYLVKGKLNHLDSHSGHGVVDEGGVQWMNAGNGIVHDEGFPPDLRATGGPFYSFQFWVNLPAKIKSKAPDYMPVPAKDLPVIDLPDGAGSLIVLLGSYAGQSSPIPAFTEQFIWHIRLGANQSVTLPTKVGHEYGGYLPEATARVAGEAFQRCEFFLFGENGEGIALENPTDEEIDVMIFGGEPYQEPVVSHGPFVMNSQEEIEQAYADYRAGKYGAINYDVPGL